jgi:MFS transporter, PHS family, inorganic phosphate transporter
MFLDIFSTILIPEVARITLEKLVGEYDMGSESITGDPALSLEAQKGANGSGSDAAAKSA